MQYTVGTQYTAHSRCWSKKVNSHSGLSKYGWWGLLPLVQKGQTHRVGIHSRYAVCSRYTVGMQYAVGTFSAKRSNPHSGVRIRYAVHSTQYTVGMQYTVGTLSAKRLNPQWGMQ